MKIKRTIQLLAAGLFLLACANSVNEIAPKNWPNKLRKLETGLTVTNSVDTVYATVNTKDPETKGKYQLQFTTTVEAIDQDLELVEFGAYFWENDSWVFTSMFGRPFNKDEFDKWYGAENGKIILGEKYADKDNWLMKSNSLNGRSLTVLLYFIGKNSEGKNFVGAKTIVGIMKMKE